LEVAWVDQSSERFKCILSVFAPYILKAFEAVVLKRMAEITSLDELTNLCYVDADSKQNSHAWNDG
jgi:hypothetical protein